MLYRLCNIGSISILSAQQYIQNVLECVHKVHIVPWPSLPTIALCSVRAPLTPKPSDNGLHGGAAFIEEYPKIFYLWKISNFRRSQCRMYIQINIL